MISTRTPPTSEHARAILRARCQEIGLVIWRIDPSGRVIERPALRGSAEDWFGSPLIARALNVAVSTWNNQDHPSPFQTLPGCWFIPFVEIHRRRRCGYSVAIAIGAELLDSEQFIAGCQGAQLDAEATRSILTTRAIWSSATVERFALLLDWSGSDLSAIAEQDSTLSGFSAQLSDSFEEISLLYTLGRSMNELEQPQKYVKLACEELLATLPFQWIAVRFVSDDRLARGMSGRLFVSGKIPCRSAEFHTSLSHTVNTLEAHTSKVINSEAITGLATDTDQILVHPVIRDGQIVGALFAGGKTGEDAQVSSFDRKLLDATTGYLSILLDNAFLYDDQQLMFVGTLEALTASIDAKDPYTCGHSQRVANLAADLARAIGLEDEQSERARIAGLVHDIGKIGVPESVLCKTGRLTRAEYERMKEHPEIGFRILKDIPMMDDLLPAVLHHHERFDGNGYPHGLRGMDIPLFARIVCVVDSFDAMSSTRTYRDAMTRLEVFAELRANANSQFDPKLIEAFFTLDLQAYDELMAQSKIDGVSLLRFSTRESAA